MTATSATTWPEGALREGPRTQIPPGRPTSCSGPASPWRRSCSASTSSRTCSPTGRTTWRRAIDRIVPGNGHAGHVGGGRGRDRRRPRGRPPAAVGRPARRGLARRDHRQPAADLGGYYDVALRDFGLLAGGAGAVPARRRPRPALGGPGRPTVSGALSIRRVVPTRAATASSAGPLYHSGTSSSDSGWTRTR